MVCYTYLQKFFNKAGREPTYQVPVRHFDAGAPLDATVISLYHTLWIPKMAIVTGCDHPYLPLHFKREFTIFALLKQRVDFKSSIEKLIRCYKLISLNPVSFGQFCPEIMQIKFTFLLHLYLFVYIKRSKDPSAYKIWNDIDRIYWNKMAKELFQN